MDQLAAKELAQEIKKGRMSKGITQQELAGLTGISLRSIQRIENGTVSPRTYSLKTIAAKLDLDVSNLIALQHRVACPVLVLTAPHNQKINIGLSKGQQIVLSVSSAVVGLSLVAAFIFQSPSFPESTFESALMVAGVLSIYAFILFRIWK